jgi:hypothetical protein
VIGIYLALPVAVGGLAANKISLAGDQIEIAFAATLS